MSKTPEERKALFDKRCEIIKELRTKVVESDSDKPGTFDSGFYLGAMSALAYAQQPAQGDTVENLSHDLMKPLDVTACVNRDFINQYREFVSKKIVEFLSTTPPAQGDLPSVQECIEYWKQITQQRNESTIELFVAFCQSTTPPAAGGGQDPCSFCGNTLREQMKGCKEHSCYRQYLNKAAGGEGLPGGF